MLLCMFLAVDTLYLFRDEGGGGGGGVCVCVCACACVCVCVCVCVCRTALVAILRLYGVPHQLVDIIQELYTGTEFHMRSVDVVPEDFQVKTGVSQGCVLSPLLFNCVMDRILREVTKMLGGGLNIEYTPAGGLFLSYWDKTPQPLPVFKMYCMQMTLPWSLRPGESYSTCWMSCTEPVPGGACRSL